MAMCYLGIGNSGYIYVYMCACIQCMCIEHRQACLGFLGMIAHSFDLGVEESRTRGREYHWMWLTLCVCVRRAYSSYGCSGSCGYGCGFEINSS
jgi:hypothetical protein